MAEGDDPAGKLMNVFVVRQGIEEGMRPSPEHQSPIDRRDRLSVRAYHKPLDL